MSRDCGSSGSNDESALCSWEHLEICYRPDDEALHEASLLQWALGYVADGPARRIDVDRSGTNGRWTVLVQFESGRQTLPSTATVDPLYETVTNLRIRAVASPPE